MYAHSRFDDEETARERKVVLEEIKRRDDDPDDLVHDLFAQVLYPGHPLGLPVIGSADVVAALTPQNLRDYMARPLRPELRRYIRRREIRTPAGRGFGCRRFG